MSTFKIPLTNITEIKPHSNADSLEIAVACGYEVIVPKEIFKVGDLVLYVPVGSVLGSEIETLLFPEDSKIKLHNSRIKAIKIRNLVSQGMLIDPEALPIHMASKILKNVDDTDSDFSEVLGIYKYQEPVSEMPKHMQVNTNINILKNPDFKQYTDVEHGKYYDRQVMTTGEEVIVTQKLHGTSARYGYFKRPVRSFMDRIKKKFGMLPEWEFTWGSRRAQINSKPEQSHPGFKSEKQGVDFGDVYTKMAKQLDLHRRLPFGYAVYGEIVGWGIQKGYLYNCGKDQHAFYVYDVMKDGKYLDYKEAVAFCKEVGLTHVPLLYRGPYIMDNILPLLTKNVISKEVNEGFVLKPINDRTSPIMGRVLLKYINPEYLLRDNSEFQ